MYDESEIIDLEAVSLNGGVLIKILVVAIDPYLLALLRRTGNPNWGFAKEQV